MNALEKVIDLVFTVLLLFFVPLLYYESGKKVAEAMFVGQNCESFLRRVCTMGEISLPVWMELEQALACYGEVTYELQRERILYEPTGEEGAIAARMYTEETEGLLYQIRTEGASRLLSGDRLWLTVYSNGVPAVYYGTVRTGRIQT